MLRRLWSSPTAAASPASAQRRQRPRRRRPQAVTRQTRLRLLKSQVCHQDLPPPFAARRGSSTRPRSLAGSPCRSSARCNSHNEAQSWYLASRALAVDCIPLAAAVVVVARTCLPPPCDRHRSLSFPSLPTVRPLPACVQVRNVAVLIRGTASRNDCPYVRPPLHAVQV